MSIVLYYDNVLDNTSTFAQSNVSGTLADCCDYLTYDYVTVSDTSAYIRFSLSAADSANSLSLVLSSPGGTVQVTTYTNSGFTDGASTAFSTAKTLSATVHTFDFDTAQASKQYWKVTFAGASGAKIQHITLGTRLDTGVQVTDTPFTPGKFGYNFEIINSMAQNGAFAGRSLLRQGFEMDVRMEHLTPAWVEANWPAFVAHAQTKPFFIVWDSTNYPNDCMYAWVRGKTSLRPRYTHPMYMAVDLPLEGFVPE